MFDWISKKIDAILEWFIGFFLACVDFLKGVVLDLFEAFLEGIRTVMSAIPVPDFLSHSMQSSFDGMTPLLLFLLSHSGLVPALALVGSAYVFRMLRKIFTLGQW